MALITPFYRLQLSQMYLNLLDVNSIFIKHDWNHNLKCIVRNKTMIIYLYMFSNNKKDGKIKLPYDLIPLYKSKLNLLPNTLKRTTSNL